MEPGNPGNNQVKPSAKNIDVSGPRFFGKIACDGESGIFRGSFGHALFSQKNSVMILGKNRKTCDTSLS